MRTLFLLLGLTLAACTEQPAGARCEQNQDCNAAASEVCRSEVSPDMSCTGNPCICCPMDRMTANGVPGCAVRSVNVVDAGRD